MNERHVATYHSNCFLFIIHHSSFITIEKVSRARRVALEARADESAREVLLELRADAEQFGARGDGVFADERGPVGGLHATPGGEEASDEVSIALAGAQRQARHVLKMGVVVTEPLLQRWDGAPALPWVRHAVVVEEADEGAQPLGRFGQVAVPVFGEAGAILVDESAIDLTEED